MSDRERGTTGRYEGGGRQPLRVIAITSGKGGVGKTSIVANLGYEFTRRGRRVLMLDGDLGLANLNIVLGLHSRYNIQHVLDGTCRLGDVLLEGPGGMHLLPSSSGVLEMTKLTAAQHMQLIEEVELLEDRYDVLLIDTAAGISENVLFLVRSAQEVIVVVTPEPTSITDAYATMKVLAKHHRVNSFRILVNVANSSLQANHVFRKLSTVVNSFLNVSLDYLGYIHRDPEVSKSILARKLLLERAPSSAAAQDIVEVAERLLSERERPIPEGSLGFFWRRLLREAQGGEYVA